MLLLTFTRRDEYNSRRLPRHTITSSDTNENANYADDAHVINLFSPLRRDIYTANHCHAFRCLRLPLVFQPFS